MLRVQVFQSLARDVRVDLRGRQVAVSEQHLHHPQVGAVIEQVGRKGMAQGVRRQLFADAGLARVALDDVPEGLARHAITAARGKQVIGLAFEQDLTARAPVEFPDRAHRLLAERNESLAIALAENADNALVQVDLALAQVHELRHAQAGRVQHLEHGAVAAAERIAHQRRRQQRFDLLLGERAGERAADLRHGDLRGGILADLTLAHQVAEETAEAGKLTCRGARPRSGMHTPGNEILKICAGSAHHGDGALGQPSRQSSQVRAVHQLIAGRLGEGLQDISERLRGRDRGRLRAHV